MAVPDELAPSLFRSTSCSLGAQEVGDALVTQPAKGSAGLEVFPIAPADPGHGPFPSAAVARAVSALAAP